MTLLPISIASAIVAGIACLPGCNQHEQLPDPGAVADAGAPDPWRGFAIQWDTDHRFAVDRYDAGCYIMPTPPPASIDECTRDIFGKLTTYECGPWRVEFTTHHPEAGRGRVSAALLDYGSPSGDDCFGMLIDGVATRTKDSPQ